LYIFSTECPTRYLTWHLFNNFTTNEDIATKFEVNLPHCVRNVKEKNVLLFKFRCNIFIGVKIIKEMPDSVASGTPCILCILCFCIVFCIVSHFVYSCLLFLCKFTYHSHRVEAQFQYINTSHLTSDRSNMLQLPSGTVCTAVPVSATPLSFDLTLFKARVIHSTVLHPLYTFYPKFSL
jgi:hypothetical protein